MHIAVLGAGAWGTAIASHAAAAPGNSVLLWGREAAALEAISRQRENPRYLPGCALHPALVVRADFAAALHQAELILVATPVAGLRSALANIAAFQTAANPANQAAVVWLCKGFEAGTQQLPHEIAQQVLAHQRYGVLSGPSFASEVALGLPVALTVAGPSAAVQQTVVSALHHAAMRIYTSPDMVGVEVGGAVKNVLAIATGISDGLQLGANARAALITRALVEMTRLCTALGGQADTVMGLSGLGDLVLTATGDLSRNRKVGLQLAQGKPLNQVLADLGHVAEGVYCARSTLALAEREQVDMPITRAVCSVLDGSASPASAVSALLSRQAKPEL